MSDEKVAQAARRFVYARGVLAHIHIDIHNADRDHDLIPTIGARGGMIEEEHQRWLARQAALREEATKAGGKAVDAFLDLMVAIREEDVTR